jgi:hypothetical protein
MTEPLSDENKDPAQCPFFRGQGTCDGSAGACFYAGEPLCITEMPMGGYK